MPGVFSTQKLMLIKPFQLGMTMRNYLAFDYPILSA
jgi:hypothetical protein